MVIVTSSSGRKPADQYADHQGTSYHPNFLFNQFGMLERCALRHGNVHSADGWRDILDPVIARYSKRDILRFYRADAAYAMPAIYERLEEARYFYAIRLPANNVLREMIAHRLTRPVGRPSQTKVKRFFEDFQYQAASWDKERRVIAKIEWHPGELFPRVMRHARAITFQLAEVAVTGPMVRAILTTSADCERHRHARDSDPRSN